MTLKITYVELPKNKYSIKCPYPMKPIGITYHETWNDAPAKNEVSFMQGNNNKTSFHYAVDDEGAIQCLPLNRNAWHAGDGSNGKGNRKTLSLECCYSKSGGAKYEKAFDNSLTLIAMKLKEYKWTVKDVYYHQSFMNKECPHRALANGITLEKFRKMVQERYDELYPVKKKETFFTSKGYYSYGDVHVNVGKIAKFMNKTFPSYSPKSVLGIYYGRNIEKSIKEFQKRTGLVADGCVGPITLSELIKYGFTYK